MLLLQASSALSEKKKLQSKLSDSQLTVENVAERDREVSELREQLATLQLQLATGQGVGETNSVAAVSVDGSEVRP